MNAFAVAAEGVAGDGELLQIEGYDSNGGGAKQRINSLETLSRLLPVRCRIGAVSAFQDYGGFENGNGGDLTGGRGIYDGSEFDALGFVIQNGKYGGCVQSHWVGTPNSSYPRILSSVSEEIRGRCAQRRPIWFNSSARERPARALRRRS